jgi:hypothetical protein
LILKQLVGARAKIVSDRLPAPKNTEVQIVGVENSILSIMVIDTNDPTMISLINDRMSATLEDLALVDTLEQSYMWPVKLPFIYPNGLNRGSEFIPINIEFKNNYTKGIAKFASRFLNRFGVSEGMYATPVVAIGDLHVSGLEFSTQPLSPLSSKLQTVDNVGLVTRNLDFCEALIESVYKIDMNSFVSEAGPTLKSRYLSAFDSKFNISMGGSFYQNSHQPRSLVIGCFPTSTVLTRLKSLL